MAAAFGLGLFFIFLLPWSGSEGKFYSADIARERLITDLFVNYDAATRPKEDRIDVTVNMELQHFDFHERDGAFNFVGLLVVSWRDPKLGWNPRDYNNISKISVSQKLVWVPDLEVYNNAPDKFLRMHRNGAVVLQRNGDIFWSDVVDVKMFCTTNFHNWPHDRHECKMSLGSWTYHGFELDVVTSSGANTSMNFDKIDMKNMQYKIINFTAEHVATVYDCCTEPYITIDYHITFERFSAFVVIFRAPAFCVILLSMLALCLEPWRGEKILLNSISFTIIILNLLYFAGNIGKYARSTPLIVIFYSFSLVLVTLNHLITIFALMATRTRFRGKLHSRFSTLLKHPFVQYIAPPQKTKNFQPLDTADVIEQFEDVKLQEFSQLISVDWSPNEWTHLAIVLERIAILIFGFIYLILGTACFV